MAVRGKRADGSPPGGDNNGDSMALEAADPPMGSGNVGAGKLRKPKPSLARPVATSGYSVTGSDVPNVEYSTGAEEEDIQRELAALDEGRRVEGPDVADGVAESAANLPDKADRGQLPVPPARNVQNPREFFAYWRSISKKALDRVVVYVYRKWPVTDKYWCPECEESISPPSNKRMPSLCLACGWKGKISTHIDKLVNPIEEGDVLILYGTGHYLFMLIDTDKAGGIVCSTQVRTGVDFRMYPPAIADKRDVVVGDPTNRAYVEYLRANKQKLKGDKEQESEEYDMAQTSDMVNKLVDKIIDLNAVRSKRIGRRRGGSDSGLDKAALNRITDVMAKTAEQSNAFILSAAEQARNMQGNPVDMFREIGSIVKELSGGGGHGVDSGSMVQVMQTFLARDSEMNKSVLELYRKENETQREELRALKQGMLNKQTEPPKTIKDTLKEMAEMKEFIRELAGTDEDKGSGSDGFDWAGLAAKMLPIVMQGVVAVTHNLAVVKSAESGKTDMKPVSAMDMQQMTADQQPAAAPVAAQQPKGEEEMNMLAVKQYMEMFGKIQPRLVFYLQMEPDECDGGTFADELVGWHGTETYGMLQQLGPDNLKGLLLQWGGDELKRLILTKPQQFEAFIAEFLTAFNEPHEGEAALEPINQGQKESGAVER